jgi:hypothetical protein
VPKTFDEEKTASSIYVEKTQYLPAKKMKLDPHLSSCMSISSKWIQDLNIRPETFEASTEKSRKCPGINKHRQGLPQESSNISATKRKG